MNFLTLLKLPFVKPLIIGIARALAESTKTDIDDNFVDQLEIALSLI